MAGICFGQFFDVSFLRSFVSSSCATLLGVCVGVPFALWIERMRSQKSKKAQQRELLRILHEALTRNQKIITNLLRDLGERQHALYNVDTSLLESTASIKYELVNDLPLNNDLDTILYDLLHLHRYIELQRDYFLTDDVRRRSWLIGNWVMPQLEEVQKKIQEGLVTIRSRMSESG